MKPLVSVIVPLYNASPFICETLQSIVASTYRPIEVVVVDDGSTDDSLDIALAFAKEHAEVRVFSQPDRGVSAARNHAISEAKGEWILPVDSDDKISPYYIEHAVAAIRDDLRVIGCKARLFGAADKEWKLPQFSHRLLARKNMIHVSSMFRKADWDKVRGFCEEDIYREDWDFWLSLFELGGNYLRLDEIGLFYRVQPSSRRMTAKQHKRAIVDAINRRHPAYMQKYLGGPLHYHRTWSRLINLCRSVRQKGDFERWNEGTVLFGKRNILRMTDGVVVKQFAIPSLWRGLVYGLLRKSKARRSYEYALLLHDLTPAPVAYREVRYWGVLRDSWYACRLSPCTHTFNELINTPGFPHRDDILRSIGRFTAALHKKGVLHGDYSGGNLLFNDDGSVVQVIDLNRISMHRRLSRKQRLLNFERLNIDRSALRTIAEAYAGAMGENADEDARFIIEHRWYKHVKQGITNL